MNCYLKGLSFGTGPSTEFETTFDSPADAYRFQAARGTMVPAELALMAKAWARAMSGYEANDLIASRLG